VDHIPERVRVGGDQMRDRWGRVPDEDAMMIIARRTWIEWCLPLRTIRGRIWPSSSASQHIEEALNPGRRPPAGPQQSA
jgi:hypothetical protein